jgi:tetratricopeptide (TPR) repeat protein
MLKSKLLLLLLLFLGTFQQMKSQVAQLFEKANQLYEKEAYQGAFELYDSIEKMNYYSAELFLNKANAAFKLDSLVIAVYYYEKAIKLNPSMQEAFQNLEVVNSKLFGGKAPIHSKSVSLWISQIFKGNYDNLAWLATILSIFITVILISKKTFNNDKFNRIFPLIFSIVLIFFIVSIVLTFTIYKHTTNAEAAIVNTENCEAMKEPSKNSSVSFKIQEGLKVFIEDENMDWYKIKFGTKIGWILKETVIVI